MLISRTDREIIRGWAQEQLAMSNSPQMQQLKQEWTRHNDCVQGRPMITIEWGTFADEAVTPLLRTKGKIAREVERKILSGFVGQMLFADDSVVNDYIGIERMSSFTPFDIKVQKDSIKDSVGHHFRDVITDLESGFNLLKPSTFSIRKNINAVIKSYIENIVGDILPVKYIGRSLYAVPTQDVVHIMSMENMLYNMYDYPELFTKMMDMLSDDYIKYFRHLEKEQFLLPTNGAEWVGQGSYAFNSTLKGEGDFAGNTIKTTDIWGFMDSQETSTISPDMYEEYIFPYYKKIAEQFGMLSYGCCEAVDPIWDNCISKLDNLRKVSISPWCNEEIMGEHLRGRKTVYHRKPSPNYLGVDKELDVEGFKSHIKKTVDATHGCVVEFTQRDVYTVHNNMDKVREYVKIIRSLTN